MAHRLSHLNITNGEALLSVVLAATKQVMFYFSLLAMVTDDGLTFAPTTFVLLGFVHMLVSSNSKLSGVYQIDLVVEAFPNILYRLGIFNRDYDGF